MYFPSTSFALVLLSSALAIHPFVLSNPHHKSNQSATRSLDHLQYRIPRSLIDTCVSLDADLSLNFLERLSILEPLLAPLTTHAATDLCLCLKDLDVYLETNTSIQTLRTLSGVLTALIDTSPNSRQCDLPFNAKRSCTKRDPCHWTCKTNFTRQGNVCVCSAPHRLCNGMCSESCGAIPSSVPGLSKAKSKRYQRLDVNTVVYANINLLDQLTNLLKLAVELKLGGSRLATPAPSSEEVVYPVLQSVADLLSSPQVASLLTNTKILLDSIIASLRNLDESNCTDLLGLQDLVAELEAMLAGTVDLQQWLATNPVGTIGATNSTSHHATISNASNMPIVLNLSGLLDNLEPQTNATIHGLRTVNDFVAFLLEGFGTTDASPSNEPLLETNVAIRLNKLLDSVLRLVLDVNDVAQFNVSLDDAILQRYVGDIVKATDNLVDSILDGHLSGLELSNLLDLTGTVKTVVDHHQGGPLASINVDLDRISKEVEAMTQQSSPSSDLAGPSDLKFLMNDLRAKRLRLDAAVQALGLAVEVDSLTSASVAIDF